MENFQFEVLPEVSMFTDKVRINLSGLEKGKKVKITSRMILPWDRDSIYTAYGIYKVNENGSIDLEKDAPIEGSYKGIDPMGLIKNIKKEVEGSSKILVQEVNSSDEIELIFSIEVDNFKAERVVKRLIKPLDVVSEKTDVDGFIGEMLYHDDNTSRKTILLLGGFEGGINSIIPMAGAIAAEGFNVLALAYFGVGYLPNKLSKIPIEYFEKAMEWLRKKSYVDINRIGVIGLSKGAELALLLASKYDYFKCVAALMPSNYCMESISGLFGSKAPWTYKGEELDYISIDRKAYLADLFKSMSSKNTMGYLNAYKSGLENAENREEAKINVKDIKADILLISSKKDNIWQSYEFCNEIEKALEANHSKRHFEHVTFEDVGHITYAPYLPLDMSKNIYWGAKLSIGGDFEENVRAEIYSWNYLISFIRMYL